MEPEHTLTAISDDELLLRLGELVSHSRRVETDLVAHIGEVDGRGLYAREASPSMFAYCTQRLQLSESEAYRRIAVARAARKHEMLLPMLRDGRLNLTSIVMLAPLLTRENREAVLARAIHRSKRQLQELVAELSPRPDVPSLMRRLPQKRKAPLAADGLQLAPERVGAPVPVACAGSGLAAALTLPSMAEPPVTVASVALSPVAAASRPGAVEPLAPGRYKVQFTAGAELRDKLERLVTLMRSEVPSGDLATIVDRAVTEKLARLEARGYARTAAPRKGLGDTDVSPASRHVPAAVRRAVRERDGDRCRYVDEQGLRCSARDRLEFHHRHPFGMGGDHSPGNLRLLCQAHNRFMSQHDYGQRTIEQCRRRLRAASNGTG